MPKAAQGSRVALVVSPKGSFYASDQRGGIWRLRLDKESKALPAEKVETKVKGTNGLNEWA